MKYADGLQPYGPNLSEALSGSVPSVDLIQRGILDRLESDCEIDTRIDTIINLAQGYKTRARFEYENNPTGMLDPRKDALSLLYLDSLVYLGNHHKIKKNLNTNQRTIGATRDRRLDVSGITEARYQVHNGLLDYNHVYYGADDTLKFKAVESIFYDAICLLYDRKAINGAEDNTRADFIGLLGENKILCALKMGMWPNAYYGSIEDEHRFESDIVVPIGEISRGNKVFIQVKSSTQPTSQFKIDPLPYKHNHLQVFVPLGGENGWFALPASQLQSLERAINSHQ